MDSNGATNAVGNFNYLRLLPGSGSTPYGGAAPTLPGSIQAENFDDGASGVAYTDTTSGNTGGKFRTTRVDIGSTTDTGGGYYLGWTAAGEWLNYTVNVATAGVYDIEVRVASGGSGGTFLDALALTEAMAEAGASSGLLAGLFTSGIALPHIVASGNADLIDPIGFEHFATGTAAGLRDFDVMLEAKAKDLALLRLRGQLAQRGIPHADGRLLAGR